MIDENVLRILGGIPVLEGPGGIRYVRASDIPSTARRAFETWGADIESPDVPGEQPGDPILEEDYREWLGTLKPVHAQHSPTPLEKEE